MIDCCLISGRILATRLKFELLWVHVQAQCHEMFVGALYHPPKPLYNSTELLDYTERGVEALSSVFPDATIVLAGDFNTLECDSELSGLVERSQLNCY